MVLGQLLRDSLLKCLGLYLNKNAFIYHRCEGIRRRELLKTFRVIESRLHDDAVIRTECIINTFVHWSACTIGKMKKGC